MFFRMLKSDIRHNKGLNVILFIFITVASVIVFIGGGLLYSNATSRSRTEKMSNPSDVFFLIETEDEQNTDIKQQVMDTYLSYPEVSEHVFSELINVPENNIYSDVYEKSIRKTQFYYKYYLSTLPEKYDILYDEYDMPISVENGKIALPLELKRSFGFKKGDIIRIKDDDENEHELEISCFYKDPFFSPYDIELMIVSDEDYEELYGAFSEKLLFFRSDLAYESINQLDNQLNKILYDVDSIPGASVYVAAANGTNEMGEDVIVGFIISVFLIVIVVFLILIIFMITRFTMISDLKNEEKEIGVIKAIGSDTPGFRWLFSAKYSVFAIVGAIASVVIGTPLFYTVSRLFNMNSFAPEKPVVLLSGSLMVLFLLIMIIIFAVMMMRRINKISVVDALQGENHGERFGKSSLIYLHKCKKMPIPVFWVLSDILKRFRRYLFLIVAYTLGISIMLISFNLRNTVISTEFLRYMNIDRLDFWVEFSKENVEMINDAKTPEDNNGYDTINRLFKENDIPAYINKASITKGYMEIPTGEVTYMVYYDLDDTGDIVLREGVMPKLENEVVLSYYSANELGLKVGDIIDFSIMEYKDKNDEGTRVDKKLVITGFKDNMESGGFVAIMGEDFTLPYSYSSTIISTYIESDDPEAVLDEISEVFPGCTLYSGDELTRIIMYEYDVIFERIEYIIGGFVLFMCALMTYLFETIFITEERSEIALMKSVGFSEKRLKLFQLLRMTVLTLISQVLAIVIFKTLGVLLLRFLFGSLRLSGFTFLPEYLFSFVLIPTMMFTVMLVTVLSKMGSIDKISIRDITEE